MTTTESSPEVAPDPNAVTITINGRTVAARKGELIIAAADRSGDYIPRFCYHPRMSAVGMCRQCMVEVEGPRGPMMVVSCMTPVADGQIVRTDTPQVKRAHEGIVELLLANHPLDCPVCDKGGECPLQDQAFSHGPGESRYIEEKRHYEKPIAISDLVLLDRERCILCDRCTRFADEVAGDALIHFTQRGNNTQVQTFPDEPFSSYFSGNTVQICPVGALTAQPYRFKARPWDLDKTESTCTTCSVGCRITVESSRDEVVRYSGVDSDPVNHGWLCDKGRFNFESVKSEHRVSTPLVRAGETLEPASWNSALATAASIIKGAITENGPSSVAVIGGARGTNEDAHAWALLAGALGIASLDAQLDDGLPSSVFALPQATIDDAAKAATIVLLSPDLKEEAPVLYLRLRDAAAKKRSRIIEFAPKQSGLTKYAWKSVLYEPGTQTAAVASTLGDAAVTAQLAKGPVVVVVGRANLAESAAFTVDALNQFLSAVPSATVLPVLRRGNVRGAIESGLRGGDTADILRRAAAGSVNCLVLVGADPITDVADTELARRAFAAIPKIISVDTHLSASAQRAAVVLPASAFAEKDGTTTNLEGRVTTLSRRVTARGTSRPDWMVAVELADALGVDLGIGLVHDVHAKLVSTVRPFAPANRAALAARPDGVLLNGTSCDAVQHSAPVAIDRAGFGYRLVVSHKLYGAGTSVAESPSLAALAHGGALHMNPADIARVGATGGFQAKVSNDRTSVVMSVVADEAVNRGTVWVAANQPGSKIGELIDSSKPVNDVKVESI